MNMQPIDPCLKEQSRRVMRYALLSICIVVLVVSLSGCSADDGTERPVVDTADATPSHVQSFSIGDGGSGGTVRVSIDSTTAGLVDGFTLRVHYDAPGDDEAGLAVMRPDVTGALPANWEAHPAPGSGLMDWSWKLEPFIPGEFEFGPLTITYQSAGDGGVPEAALVTDPVPLTVTSVLSSDEEDASATPADIKGVLAPARPWWTAWWFITSVIVVVFVVLPAAVVLAVWLLRKRLAGQDDEQADGRILPQTSAPDLALRRLQALLGRDLMARGQVKEFYGELTWIMRQYVEDRFGLRAPDRTTEEFLTESREAGLFSSADLDLFDRFLGHCDLVKFAEAQPTSEQVAAVVQSIRTFIERTKSDDARVTIGEEVG
ncbi:MAG: hypothetical protein D8M59_04825 [Planctomycetes bacterium]|nr:hypothetical protein [Planctomycetota bacterium]NOG55831.1 hypothetical protein [Planctomycetota bacterium]